MKRFILAILSVIIVLAISFGSACSKEKQPETVPETMPETTVPEEPISTEEPEEVITFNTVSVLAAGDNLIHDGVYNDAKLYADEDPLETREHNFLPMYENIKEMVSAADLAIINQETMMAGPDYRLSGYPTFNSPQSLANDLATVGFDVLSLANNHMIDKGENGLRNTLNYLDGIGLTRIGGYLNQADMDNIRVIEKNGVRIALLAYTYGTNGISLPAGSELVVPYIDDNLIISQLQKANEISDFVMVYMHWGVENVFWQNDQQVHTAKLLAENGAGIIIGMHPHIIQKMEWMDNGKGGKVLCIYSLGNLVSMMLNDYNMLGGLLTFDITNENSETYYVKNPVFNPVVYYFNTSFRKSKLYYLKDFTEELCATHARYGSAGLRVPALYQYVKENIDASFLPDYLKQ